MAGCAVTACTPRANTRQGREGKVDEPPKSTEPIKLRTLSRPSVEYRKHIRTRMGKGANSDPYRLNTPNMFLHSLGVWMIS